MTSADGSVTWKRHGTAAIITVDRPAARNAMTWGMYEQLVAALDAIEADRGLRVAVLRGAGGGFVAGTDIAQFTDFTSGDDGIAYERRLDSVLASLEELPIPTIAVVEGAAMGGGLMLAATCDLRICTTDARFGMPIARTVGNCLSMANYARLLMHLGPSRLMQLVATAESMPAAEALARGFVLEVAEPSALEDRLGKRCEQLATMAPVTLRVTREAIRRVVRAVTAEGDDLLRLAYGSRDFREGVAAFVARRAPQWEGR
ncbi:MAG: enoyl-CoA hydratase [Gemmatimonadota bacterium]